MPFCRSRLFLLVAADPSREELYVLLITAMVLYLPDWIHNDDFSVVNPSERGRYYYYDHRPRGIPIIPFV